MRKLATLLLVLALSVLAAGCGSDDDEASPAATTAASTGASAADCEQESVETIADGRLTIGTDNPAFPPWFEGGTPEGSDWEINDPATGEGFESAVAYAVADQLGFAKGDVDWVVVPFNNSFKPGEKNFDFDINQISVTEERDRAVDFSDSYYDVNQALVGLAGTPITERDHARRLSPITSSVRRSGRRASSTSRTRSSPRRRRASTTPRTTSSPP